MSPDPITTLRDGLERAAYAYGQDPFSFDEEEAVKWSDLNLRLAFEQVWTLVEAAKAHGREGYGSSPAELAATVRFHDALRPFISGDTESG